MKKAFFAAVLVPLSFGAATLAVAGDAAGANQVAVQYSETDLQSPAGQQALKRRLTRAAQSVCPDTFAADLETRMAGAHCVKKAVGQAMGVLGERQLARASAENGNRG